MKGTLPGAALPPCRRPQHCSQSRGRPPPGAGSTAGRHPGSDRREPTRRSSAVATISPSAATQRNPKTPKGKASADHGRKDKGTTTERAYRLDFGLSRYVRRDYPRDGTRPETGGRHQNNVRSNARGTRRRRYQPGQRNPVAAAVTGNHPASPGDIADQRHGLNPGHNERHSPRRCITALSPTAALQSVPGTSAARRRIKPRTQPAGSTAGRHPGSNPREPTRRSSGSRHDQPDRSDAAEP